MRLWGALTRARAHARAPVVPSACVRVRMGMGMVWGRVQCSKLLYSIMVKYATRKVENALVVQCWIVFAVLYII